MQKRLWGGLPLDVDSGIIWAIDLCFIEAERPRFVMAEAIETDNQDAYKEKAEEESHQRLSSF
jgi:hypothetical protein